MFTRKWPDAPESYAAKLTWAVEVGERSAAYAGAGEDWAPPAGALACAAYVCDAVINADRDRLRAAEVIKATSAAVAKFKDKAENIFGPHFGAVFHVITNNTLVAIANGIATSRETYDAAEKTGVSMIRRDFDRVAELVEEQSWTDDTPVPPTIFGPLWPDKRPLRWPQELDDDDRQPNLPEATVRRISELLISA